MPYGRAIGRRRIPRRKQRALKGKGRKSRVPRSLSLFNDRGQMARIKETVAFADLDPNVGYNFNFNLSQFQRASTIAPSFKWYKATMVEWTIEPLYNTFQDGTTGAEVTIPYAYMTMNRTQDSTGLGLADIQAIGAKPKKLVAKMVIKYKPNWCSPGLTQLARYQATSPTGYALTETTSAGLQAQYSYLQCPNNNKGQNNPDFSVPSIAFNQTGPPVGINIVQGAIQTNQVLYNGHTVWVDQEVPTGTLQPVARVTCTVHWSFKDPHCTYLEDRYTDLAPK